MGKQDKVKEVMAYTYKKETNPVDFSKLIEAIGKGRVTGFVTRDGILSNNNSFADVRLIIEPEASGKEGGE